MKTQFVIVSVVAVLLAASTGVGFWMWSDTKADLADTKAELTDTKAELTDTEAELASIEVELADTEEELAQIEEVYPPRHFDTYTEFVDWVDEHTPVAYTVYTIFEGNLDLQEEALADGYIWSVYTEPDGTEIISVAVAGDSVYYVWLDGYMEWATWR